MESTRFQHCSRHIFEQANDESVLKELIIFESLFPQSFSQQIGWLNYPAWKMTLTYCWFSHDATLIRMSSTMASPDKALYFWVKNFLGYLVYELLLQPKSWRGSLYIYLLSFPRFWILSVGFDFYSDLFWMAWHWKPAIYGHVHPTDNHLCYVLSAKFH